MCKTQQINLKKIEAVAECEDRTHDLKIMRLTRYLLRQFRSLENGIRINKLVDEGD